MIKQYSLCSKALKAKKIVNGWTNLWCGFKSREWNASYIGSLFSLKNLGPVLSSGRIKDGVML